MIDPTIPDWISAFAAVVSAGAVAGGALYARYQLNVWRTEARHRRRAEVAEVLLATAHAAADVLRDVRSPLSRTPVEEAGNKMHEFERRWNRLMERNAVFEGLRLAQIRAKAVLQNDAVEKAVEQIFGARNDFWISLTNLAEAVDLELRSLAEDDRKALIKDRLNVFGATRKDNEITAIIDGALTTLDRQLGPTIRYA